MADETRAMTLRLPAEAHERLRRLAFDRRMSIATLVTKFINEGLDRLSRQEEAVKDDQVIRAKWMLDGATTLAEAAQKARQFADHLQQLHEQGYVLREPVDDDYGFYYKP